jgi:hypothetical protein
VSADYRVANLRSIGFKCATYEQGSTLSDAELIALQAMGLKRIRFINVLADVSGTISGSTFTVTDFNDSFFADGLAQCARLGLGVAIVLNVPPQPLLQLREKLGIQIGVNDASTTYKVTLAGVEASVAGQANAFATAVALKNAMVAVGAPFDQYSWYSDVNSSAVVGVALLSSTDNSFSSSKTGGAGTLNSEKNQTINSTQSGRWRFGPCRGDTHDQADMDIYTDYLRKVIEYVAGFGIDDIWLSVGNEMDNPSQDWTNPAYGLSGLADRYSALAECAVAAKSTHASTANVMVFGTVFQRPYYPNKLTSRCFEVAKRLHDDAVEIDFFDYHHYANYFPSEATEQCNTARQMTTYWAVNQYRYSGLTVPMIWSEYGPTYEWGIAALRDKRGGAAAMACLKIAAELVVKEAWPLLLKMTTSADDQYFSLGYDKSGNRSWPNKAWQQLNRIADDAQPVRAIIRQVGTVATAWLDQFIYFDTARQLYVGLLWNFDLAVNGSWVASPMANAAEAEIYLPDQKRALNFEKYCQNAGSDTAYSGQSLSVGYGDFIYFEGR